MVKEAGIVVKVAGVLGCHVLVVVMVLIVRKF
jgi:hypothetical protein